jgi:alpha-glucosidase (family GH31 glycosyl hydrolase)
MYTTRLSFKGNQMKVGIKTIWTDDDEDHYDLEIHSKKKISGHDFQALRNYLQEEGYIEAAREWNKNIV